jgi:hypothetical protein
MSVIAEGELAVIVRVPLKSRMFASATIKLNSTVVQSISIIAQNLIDKNYFFLYTVT